MSEPLVTTEKGQSSVSAVCLISALGDSSGSNDSKVNACGHFLLHLWPLCYFRNGQLVACELHLLPALLQEKSPFLLSISQNDVIYVGGVWWRCWSITCCTHLHVIKDKQLYIVSYCFIWLNAAAELFWHFWSPQFLPFQADIFWYDTKSRWELYDVEIQFFKPLIM